MYRHMLFCKYDSYLCHYRCWWCCSIVETSPAFQIHMNVAVDIFLRCSSLFALPLACYTLTNYNRYQMYLQNSHCIAINIRFALCTYFNDLSSLTYDEQGFFLPATFHTFHYSTGTVSSFAFLSASQLAGHVSYLLVLSCFSGV